MRARIFLVTGFTRVTRPPLREPTQTLRAPYATPNGLLGMPSFHFTRPAAGSTRTSRLSSRSVTHRAPPPERAKEADTPTCSLVGGAAAPAAPHPTATAITTTPARSTLNTILHYFTTRLR